MGLAGAISMALAGINLRIRSRPLLPSSAFLLSSTSSCSGRRFYLRRSSRLACVKSAKVTGRGSALREESEEEMTAKKGAWISGDRSLVVEGRTVLTDVPPEVTATPDAEGAGLFLGVELPEPSDRHVVPLGKLRNLRFLACFRFKLWWMSQRTGQSGAELPLETQFLLLELPSPSSSSATLHAVLLPLLDAPFRASLRGSPDSSLLLSLESGDPSTTSSSSRHPLLLGPALPDPFAAVASAVAIARRHLGSFRLRAEKPLPPIVDLLGWCTWDAFYQDVSHSGVEDGLRSLAAGGVPPGFVIIDDGWQTVAPDAAADDPTKPSPLMRLTRVEENHKFQSDGNGIGHVVGVAKREYGVRYVYTWHAVIGYWGGVAPGVHGAELRYPAVCEGVDGNEPGLKGDAMMVDGVGVVPPPSVFGFYDELHGYLAARGVDGVKVDVQSVLETLGGGLGGRVALAKAYHEALDRSVAAHFAGTGIIACMSHSSDALYCSMQTAVVRASDDFYPRDPISHTIHVASVSYNSVFLGEFMLPDWDMFHSLHPAADYHASARAISGGPVYVSDAPGKHDFALLRKLVLPDGLVLRARLPGRPTRDCLFTDPTRDGVSLLKIWNMNKHTGVLGVYNCQGAAWSSELKKNASHPTGTDALTCAVKGDDVHLISEAANDADWNGDCALYRHGDGEVVVLPRGVALPLSLKVLEHSIFTVTPIKVLAPGFMFAPFGLVEMYNGGGAVENLAYRKSRLFGDSIVGDPAGAGLLENKGLDPVGFVRVDVKGCGPFGAFSSTKPRRCEVDAKDTDFSYDSSSGLLKFNLEKMPENDKKVHTVLVEL